MAIIMSNQKIPSGGSTKGWHTASLRAGVFDFNGATKEFLEWATDSCSGGVIVRSNERSSSVPRVFFENQEDLVSYLLTFEEQVVVSAIEAGAYYSPYVPLTFSGVVVGSGGGGTGNPNTAAGVGTIKTRYDLTK